MAELDGSLADPVYIKGLEDSGMMHNMNTFPFALGAASMQVNLALRYLLGTSWWPALNRQEYQFTKGVATREDKRCDEGCSFPRMIAKGDASNPPYLRTAEARRDKKGWGLMLKKACMGFLNKLRRAP